MDCIGRRRFPARNARSSGVQWCAAEAGEPIVLAAASRWEEDGVALRFEELWRAGGLNEGEELAFPFSMAAAYNLHLGPL